VNHPTIFSMLPELTVISLRDAGLANNRDFTRFVQVFSRAPFQSKVSQGARDHAPIGVEMMCKVAGKTDVCG
jgi:hypothetical protein